MQTTPNQGRMRRIAGITLVALAVGATTLVGTPEDAGARDPLLQEVMEAKTKQRRIDASCGAAHLADGRTSSSYLVGEVGMPDE